MVCLIPKLIVPVLLDGCHPSGRGRRVKARAATTCGLALTRRIRLTQSGSEEDVILLVEHQQLACPCRSLLPVLSSISEVENLLASLPGDLAVGASAAAVLGVAAGVYRWSLSCYRRTIGSRRDVSHRLNPLAAGVTTRWVEERLGRARLRPRC